MGRNKSAPGDTADNHSPGGLSEAELLPDRLSRYSAARDRAQAMVAHLERTGEYGKERSAMRSCGLVLVFNYYYTRGSCRLSWVKSCKKHLLCPLCALHRSSKYLARYLGRLEVIQADTPTLRPFLVTFAVRNGADLEERWRHLTGSLQRLHNRRRLWLKGVRRSRWTEAARAQGAVWSYEVTNRGNGWHPHVHAIWLCEQAPEQQALRDEWEAITGDSWTVDVREIDPDDPASGFAEVFKYATKFQDLPLDDNVEVYRVLKGRRLIGSFGCFRGVQVPEADTDELLEDLPYMELIYRHTGRGYELASEPVMHDSDGTVTPPDTAAELT